MNGIFSWPTPETPGHIAREVSTKLLYIGTGAAALSLALLGALWRLPRVDLIVTGTIVGLSAPTVFGVGIAEALKKKELDMGDFKMVGSEAEKQFEMPDDLDLMIVAEGVNHGR